MKNLYLNIRLILMLGIFAWACSDNDPETRNNQPRAIFLQEQLIVSGSGGEAIVLLEWSFTSWEIVMNADNGMISKISQTQGGNSESQQQFTKIKFYFNENIETKSKTQEVFLVNKTTQERSKLIIEQNTTPYSYLKDYHPLKSYIDRSANPNFKLGVGIEVHEFLQKETIYDVAYANFDELVAGNAMKYGSVVKNDGSMDFSQVTSFVNTVRGLGLSVYGHTLCWHSQQNRTYLNNLIADRKEPGGAIVKSDFEDGKALMGWGNNSIREVINGEGFGGTKGMMIVNPSEANPWSAQTGYDFNEPMVKGETYFLKLKIKGNVEESISAGFQNPSNYSGCGDFPPIPITTEWKEISVQTQITGENAKRFLFNVGKYVGTIWVDDISIHGAKAETTTPIPPGEKAEILSGAMENWVKGMMDACDGYVKAWDLVNEPMSDGNPFELKSAKTESNAEQHFYWQDYLGKDYVRIVAKFARQYGQEDIKLFVNDYNLEASYNNNQKCEGLIKMIEYWESDGVTRIDGIGTQMHVTCSMDPETQRKSEQAIVRMFEMLRVTGKLIKISELDMGLKLSNNSENVLTVNMTEEQHKAMAKFYNFIVRKYLEIIPANQQYGITQWCSTDSPENSYWRKGQPVGLWDLGYNRKHTYAGFADGLAGKEYRIE